MKRIIIYFLFLFNCLIAQKEALDTVFYSNKNVKTIRYRSDYLFADRSIKREFRPSKNLSKIKDILFYDGLWHKPSTGFIYFYNDSAYGGLKSYYGTGPQKFSYSYGFPYFNNLKIEFRFNTSIQDTVLTHFSIYTEDSITGKVRDFIYSIKEPRKTGII